MSDVINVLLELLATALGILGGWLLLKLKAWLDDKQLGDLISDAVQAAEQTLKDGDEAGIKRLAYVRGLILAAGYMLTDTVSAKIEAAVYELNQRQKTK